MLNLSREHALIRKEIDAAIASVIDSSAFIKGTAVQTFESELAEYCLLYTSPSPRDLSTSRMPSSA